MVNGPLKATIETCGPKAEEKEALKAKTEAQASPRSGEQRIAAKAEQFDYESRHVKR